MIYYLGNRTTDCVLGRVGEETVDQFSECKSRSSGCDEAPSHWGCFRHIEACRSEIRDRRISITAGGRGNCTPTGKSRTSSLANSSKLPSKGGSESVTSFT